MVKYETFNLCYMGSIPIDLKYKNFKFYNYLFFIKYELPHSNGGIYLSVDV
jgi:hypothetical protein